MKRMFEEHGWVIISAIVITLIVAMASPVGVKVKESITGILSNFGGTTNTITTAMPDNYATLLGTGIADGDKDGLHYHNNKLFTGNCENYHYVEGVKQYQLNTIYEVDGKYYYNGTLATGIYNGVVNFNYTDGIKEYQTDVLYEKDGLYYFNGTLANGTYYGAKYVMGERFTGVDGSTYYEEGILGTGSYAGVYYKNGEEQFSLNTDLTVLMNDIEAAIQAKTGSTNPIAPDDFPDEINGIKTGKQVFDLGTNTSFDVKTVCQQNGIDYTKLTANNFLFSDASTYNITLAKYVSDNYAPTGSTKLVKSYNATSGTLTAYMNTYISWVHMDGSGKSTSPTGKVHAYLIY